MCTDGQSRTFYTHGHTRTATDVMCVQTNTHGCPVCADGHPRTHGRPVCVDGQPQTATDIMCVLADTHGYPVCTEQTAHVGQNYPNSGRDRVLHKQSPGRASVLSPRTNVLICVLMDSHGRPVCADGHTRTATDVLCVLTDTHGCPVCADGHPRMSCVHGRPVCADGHTWTATDILCVLTNSHRQPRTSCVCWRTPTDVLCVLNRQPTWAKITQTVPRKGQRAESKDQRADMCTDGQPRTSCVC
uniref:Uncharacterized protein n=1 Tax=Brassica campestris TaxID=3711 RepID=A0A3P5YZ67_BRACM|nr:unnamed protein product [Brassica rapa]